MRLLLALLLAAALATGAAAQGAAPAPEPEEETVFPDGEGRSETFAYCTVCHGSAIIRRSAFSRQQWDGLMDWMTERHGMNPLEGEFRDLIVDYLAKHFGPRAPARGRNPFLN